MRDKQVQLSILIFGLITYLLSPILYWEWLVYELKSGTFPVHADSIGIPMAGFLLIWLIGWMILPFGYSIYTAARGAGRNGEIREQIAASGVK